MLAVAVLARQIPGRESRQATPWRQRTAPPSGFSVSHLRAPSNASSRSDRGGRQGGAKGRERAFLGFALAAILGVLAAIGKASGATPDPSAVAQQDPSVATDPEEEARAEPAAPPEPSQTVGAADGRSGYAGGVVLENPDGVSAELAQDDLNLGSMLRIPWLDGLLVPWFEAKRRWNEKYGLQLQFSYQALYQRLDESPGEDTAAGGRGEIQGMWILLNRGEENAGALSFRWEHRHTLGTEIPPTKLGGEVGSASVIGLGFSDFGGALTELAWRQTLFGGRMKLGIGKISAIAWYNGFVLSTAKKGFQNSALQSSASKPSPGRGIGLVSGFQMGKQTVVIAGIHDANASTPDNPFDTIDQTEFYESMEVRWFPTTFERSRFDQVRLQIWHQDQRDEAGIPAGQGVTFAASFLFHDFFMPFLLGGISDGDASIMEKDLVGGIAFAFNTAHRAARDVLGLGVSWGRPSNPLLRDQTTAEVFYKLQLVQHIAITGSVQWTQHPALDRGLDEVWVGGVRLRMTF